jgi:hypothetical protein
MKIKNIRPQLIAPGTGGLPATAGQLMEVPGEGTGERH